MMCKCSICGRRFFTGLDNRLWPYSYKDMVFCSQDCEIVHKARDLHKVDFLNLTDPDMRGIYPPNYIPVQEGPIDEEGEDDMRGQKLLTDEQKEKAVQIAMEGGDPIKYLKGCGAVNPWGNWGYIKMLMQKNDPEKYDRLMKAMHEKGEEKEKKRKEQREKLEKLMNPVEVEKVDKLPETVMTISSDGISVKRKETNPTKKQRKINLVYKVIGIETKLGKFQYDHASDQLRWMPKNSTVVIMMPAEDWKQLAEDMPHIMKTIGAGEGEEEE